MAHRYWRIYVTKSTSGANMLLSLYEMEWRIVAGGADVCTSGVASASHANVNAGLLVDNNTSSYWDNGAPGTDCWFQYDFGAGNAKQIVELRIFPRFQSQSPEDFKCQCSNDGVNWVDRGLWVGETAWLGGMWKTLSLPVLESVPVQKNQLYSLILVTSSQRDWVRFLQAHLLQPVHDVLDAFRLMPWSLHTQLVKGHQQPRADTMTTTMHSSHSFGLLPKNPACSTHIAYWDLSWPVSVTNVSCPTIGLNGRSIALLQGTLTCHEDNPAWVARLSLGLDADFLPFNVEEPVSLNWGQVSYAMLVEQKNLLRTQPDQVERWLTATSLSVRHDFPRATPVTRSWHESAWAKDVVEEVLGESVEWDLPNWRLAGERFGVTGVAPLAVAKIMAAAVGGVVQARPNGTLWLRRRFLLSVPDWDLGTPDHVFTDGADLLATREVGQFGGRINQITVQEEIPNGLTPYLWLGVDKTLPNHNQGKIRFAPGETVHLLSLAGPGVEVTGLAASTGAFMPTEPALRQVSEELIFTGSNRAVLSRPARSLDAVIWLGNSLGDLCLEKDGRTVTAQYSGVAIARVTMTLMTYGCHPFKAPNTLTGLSEFPSVITCQATVANSGIRSLTLRRNDGLRVGQTIASPLLSDPAALQARGEAELDLGELLGKVHLTLLYRPGIEPGDLVEVHDGMYGASYRGVVVGVTYDMRPTGTFTHLELVKRG